MKTPKQVVFILPEYILIVAVLFYWTSSSVIFNPIAISLILLLIFQIIYQNKVVGLLIPSLLIIGCCFMLLALLSEFNEFPTFNAESKKLLFVGLSFFLGTITVSVIMIYKYLKQYIVN